MHYANYFYTSSTKAVSDAGQGRFWNPMIFFFFNQYADRDTWSGVIGTKTRNNLPETKKKFENVYLKDAAQHRGMLSYFCQDYALDLTEF